MNWLHYTILLLLQITGIALTLFTLPGIWLMVAAAALYAWITRGQYIGPWTLTILFALALVAELIETFAASKAVRSSGGSRRASVGALLGGILGAIFFIPAPVIGTILGACVGVFIGALVMEFTKHGRTNHSLKVGFTSAGGKFVGSVLKVIFAVLILLVSAWQALPFHLF